MTFTQWWDTQFQHPLSHGETSWRILGSYVNLHFEIDNISIRCFQHSHNKAITNMCSVTTVHLDKVVYNSTVRSLRH